MVYEAAVRERANWAQVEDTSTADLIRQECDLHLASSRAQEKLAELRADGSEAAVLSAAHVVDKMKRMRLRLSRTRAELRARRIEAASQPDYTRTLISGLRDLARRLAAEIGWDAVPDEDQELLNKAQYYLLDEGAVR